MIIIFFLALAQVLTVWYIIDHKQVKHTRHSPRNEKKSLCSFTTWGTKKHPVRSTTEKPKKGNDSLRRQKEMAQISNENVIVDSLFHLLKHESNTRWKNSFSHHQTYFFFYLWIGKAMLIYAHRQMY